MGLFDTIRFQCRCGARVHFQTKEWMNSMTVYDADEVPTNLAEIVDDKTVICDYCQSEIKFRMPPKVPCKVALMLIYTPAEAEYQ